MSKLTAEERAAYAAIGKRGGKANAAKHGVEHMRKIGLKGVLARRRKKKKAL